MERTKVPDTTPINAYLVEEEPIVLSKALFDTLLKEQNPGDLISLYSFYYYTAKWQKTNKPKATDEYCQQGLKWGYTRFINAQKRLIELGLIERHHRRNVAGHITGWFIHVSFIWKTSSLEALNWSGPVQGEQSTNSSSTVSRNSSSSGKRNAGETYPLSWELLCKKYNPKHVKFVKWYLDVQKCNYPNFLKEEITPTNPKVESSLQALDKLCRIDGFDFDTEVKPILSQVPHDEFWARNLLCLSSLREKGRNGEKKFINITLNIQSMEAAKHPVKIVKTPPEEIIKSEVKDEYDAKSLIDLLHIININENGDKTKAASGMCNIIRWYNKKQERPKFDGTPEYGDPLYYTYGCWELVPQPVELVKRYVKWLNKQDWIDKIQVVHFDPDGKMFTKFLDAFQNEVGVDFFDGHSLH